MISIENSKAFNEFIYARCEEILNDGSKFKEINKKISECEKRLKEILTDEQWEMFLELDNIQEQLISQKCFLIYKTCLTNIPKFIMQNT